MLAPRFFREREGAGSKALQRAKLSANFNEAIAEQLMIAAAPPDNAIPDDAKPKGAGTAMTGSVVRIDWTKGKFDGVYIDSQRADETDWTRLGFDMRSRQASPKKGVTV